MSTNPLPWRHIIFCGALVCLAVLTILAVNNRFGLKMRVYVKDNFQNHDMKDKLNDALLVYADKDAELALGVLLPTLESKYHYKCGSRELPADINTCKYSRFLSNQQVNNIDVFRVY